MFKKYLKISLIFFLLFSFALAKTEIEVIKVYDGDSILARIDENIFRIRIIDIDCFEGTPSKKAKIQAENFNLTVKELNAKANIAKNILKETLKNKKVYFDFKGIDKYNRALGHLYVDNKNINQIMLKTNYCYVY